MDSTIDYNTIINTINNNVLQAIKSSLQPLWVKIEQEKSNYQTIVDMMRNMPEFKSMLVENELLIQQLKEKEKEKEKEIDLVRLEVRENKPLDRMKITELKKDSLAYQSREFGDIKKTKKITKLDSEKNNKNSTAVQENKKPAYRHFIDLSLLTEKEVKELKEVNVK